MEHRFVNNFFCSSCGLHEASAFFYKKGKGIDSICKSCRKEKRKNQYRKSSPLIPKPNFESIHVDVTLVSGNDWSSIVFSILKSNFLESNDPQSTEDIKINNKLSGIAKE